MFCAKSIIIITPNQLPYSDWESKDGFDEISVKVHHHGLPKVNWQGTGQYILRIQDSMQAQNCTISHK